ncbi:hypothetical protein BDF14DRAFT_1796037 [Spinellus fusiger]|nr:hypothetical protein BDF14DRAFT_1796037 [Spinellus fusiger]
MTCPLFMMSLISKTFSIPPMPGIASPLHYHPSLSPSHPQESLFASDDEDYIASPSPLLYRPSSSKRQATVAMKTNPLKYLGRKKSSERDNVLYILFRDMCSHRHPLLSQYSRH